MGERSQVGALLDQIDGPIGKFTADGAYDGDPTYDAVSRPPLQTPKEITNRVSGWCYGFVIAIEMCRLELFGSSDEETTTEVLSLLCDDGLSM